MHKGPRWQLATAIHQAALEGTRKTSQKNQGPGMNPWSRPVLLALKCLKLLLKKTTSIVFDFRVLCYHSLSSITINVPSGISQKDPAASQLWNSPSKDGHWLPWKKKKKPSKNVAQVWKITIETCSGLRNTFQNKPNPGERVVPQTSCSFPTL